MPARVRHLLGRSSSYKDSSGWAQKGSRFAPYRLDVGLDLDQYSIAYSPLRSGCLPRSVLASKAALSSETGSCTLVWWMWLRFQHHHAHHRWTCRNTTHTTRKHTDRPYTPTKPTLRQASRPRLETWPPLDRAGLFTCRPAVGHAARCTVITMPQPASEIS